jgi:hypothetical protein
MTGQAAFLIIDIAIVVIANAVNLLMTGIFLSRPPRWRQLEYVLGIIVMALGIPILAAIAINAAGRRTWWAIVLPIPLVLLCVVELLLDYVLKLPFRQTWLLGPYLGIYYLAQFGMIGYAFLVGKVHGFVTLGTYFACLFATWYSYSRVKHGRD